MQLEYCLLWCSCFLILTHFFIFAGFIYFSSCLLVLCPCLFFLFNPTQMSLVAVAVLMELHVVWTILCNFSSNFINWLGCSQKGKLRRNVLTTNTQTHSAVTCDDSRLQSMWSPLPVLRRCSRAAMTAPCAYSPVARSVIATPGRTGSPSCWQKHVIMGDDSEGREKSMGLI